MNGGVNDMPAEKLRRPDKIQGELIREPDERPVSRRRLGDSILKPPQCAGHEKLKSAPRCRKVEIWWRPCWLSQAFIQDRNLSRGDDSASPSDKDIKRNTQAKEQE
jgi:hypothetical protein